MSNTNTGENHKEKQIKDLARTIDASKRMEGIM